LPSVKEGLPYCLIEAGYAGIPVVATTVGGIPELIDDMQTGILIQPKKSEEIFMQSNFSLNTKRQSANMLAIFKSE
jgi:glycosyltransferase involved in cell wall biosynthesis